MTNKFRVWCKDRNQWEEHDVYIGADGELFHCLSNGRIMPLRPDSHMVSWFTGLTDKNGKEIYTDHVLKYTKINYTDCSRKKIESIDEPVAIRILQYHPMASIIKPCSSGVKAIGWDTEEHIGLTLEIESKELEIMCSFHDNPELFGEKVAE